MSTLDERLARRTSLGTWTFDNRFSYRGGLGRIYGYDGSSEPPTDPGYTPTDPDATTYIAAVEAADGQALEDGVKAAYDDFFIGCKADGIWNAIKASCILAGARTLAGALVPLVGTAPTNFNFVSGDYDRETGLTGDSISKYLDSNRRDDADPQNSHHLSIYLTSTPTNNLAGVGISSTERATRLIVGIANSRGAGQVGMTTEINCLTAVGRSAVDAWQTYSGGILQTFTTSSASPVGFNHYIFAQNRSGTPGANSASRFAFYSIGESLDLAALDTRVSALITAIGAAIV